MIDRNKLRAILIERGMNIEELANKLGIDRSTLYRKLGSQGKLSIEEAQAIVKELDLSNEQALQIFFKQKFAYNAKTKRGQEV